MKLCGSLVKLLNCSTNFEPFAILLGRKLPDGSDGDPPS